MIPINIVQGEKGPNSNTAIKSSQDFLQWLSEPFSELAGVLYTFPCVFKINIEISMKRLMLAVAANIKHFHIQK